MNKSSRLVCGMGAKGMSYPASMGGKDVEEYKLWHMMLVRCTEPYWRDRPTYTGTSCSENFRSYPYFYEWCQEQTGFKNKDEHGRYWQLDKDLLVKGNKLYSEDICVFVPSRINSLLNKRKSARGECPIGVCLYKTNGKFISQCADGKGKLKTLGYYNTAEEAFHSYKIFKEDIIKRVAEEYKSQIDIRVYKSLMNYNICAED